MGGDAQDERGALVAEIAAQWRAVLDALDDPVFVHDESYRLVRVNRAYARQAGLDFDELLGRPYWEVFPRGEGPLESCRRALASGEEHAERLEDDAGTVWHARAFSAREAAGSPPFSVHILHDITRQERDREALERVTRSLRVLSGGNQALLHSEGEAELLQEVGCVVTREGGYAGASILRPVGGPASPMEARMVEPAGTEVPGLDAELARAALDSGRPRVWPLRDRAIPDGRIAAFPLERELQWGVLVIRAADAGAFGVEEMPILHELSRDIALGLHYQAVRRAQQASEREMQRSLEGSIQVINRITELADPYTAGHQGRVSRLCRAIGEQMGWDEERLRGLEIGASIHDVGKTAIPSGLLNKSGALSTQEFELIKMHAANGWEMVQGVDFPWPVAEMIHQHHERLDGSGYPRGLRGEEIAPEARILAVADIYEAMTSHRPYRPALPRQAAIDALWDQRGTALEPLAVDACLEACTILE